MLPWMGSWDRKRPGGKNQENMNKIWTLISKKYIHIGLIIVTNVPYSCKILTIAEIGCGGIWEPSALSLPFFYKSKTILSLKVFKINLGETKVSTAYDDYPIYTSSPIPNMIYWHQPPPAF